jgi:hypothetical protein
MKLMAPPRPNFQEVYAAGKKIAHRPTAEQFVAGKAALQQFGTYDFKRDKATVEFPCRPRQAQCIPPDMSGGENLTFPDNPPEAAAPW